MTDTPRPTRIVIAGGGTAGWLAAAILTRQLGQLADITLVESEEIGTIGVGESTIPTIRAFHTLIGVDEQEFMAATGASFKLGISFENWARDGDRYIHSFGDVGKSTWMSEFQHFWLEARAQGVAGPLGDYCPEHQAAAAHRFATGPDAPLSYAYHFDAGRYARFLRQRCEQDGLTRVEGRIGRIERDGVGGDIAAIVMENGTRIEGDLFFDCTGFRGMLIDETLGIGYEDWSHWLPTDRAVAMQTASTGPAVPYTRAIAHDCGWRWKIPLQHRVGNGLVYCSAYLDDDAARDRLLSQVEGRKLIEPRLIRYRTGRRKEAWHRNCIALSLAGGFVEPLESTSIHLIMIALIRFLQLYPGGKISEAAIARFNEQSRTEIEGVRDFIILHYHLNERDEPFWRERREMRIPDSLAERIDLFRQSANAYQASHDLFRVASWTQVMFGQRLEPVQHHPVARLMPPGELQQILASISAQVAATVSQLPHHQTFLDRYCPESKSAAAA
ncbi:tryptophan halogenase family protein [Sphingomonas prati]|uniref:Tryptophan halogenase n=1 Tax=Sphingomonas prati TaxID=1843237 RepID=A0A7W9BUK9_9SPHN|nr:tryptophan halogenase family protein [Sphingomonas prati]MBB5730194.1 tryptophan halogenase [Sphingomonas prati]GGE92268.1 tryptophan halogenase [Sphingomonas prati]